MKTKKYEGDADFNTTKCSLGATRNTECRRRGE